ncbi:MAG: NUDIX domain-containing protein [Streptosporangiales bacterium]|nr:NUDIX domain-containing protein [Streptosporangiales bacterium]
MTEREREFFAGLPRTRGAATALLLDDGARYVIVDPTYKPLWSLPGGVIEDGESPFTACHRECREELGVDVTLDRLLCVDWLPDTHGTGAANIFVFLGHVTAGQTERFRLPPDELAAWRLITSEETAEFLPPAMSRRVRACLTAARDGSTLYLEDGTPV